MTQPMIENIRLHNVHLSVVKPFDTHCQDNIIAAMNVQYNLEKDPCIISYHIQVKTELEETIFHVKCDYYFDCDSTCMQDDIVNEVVELLKPRLEELLTLFALEVGYQSIC